MSGTDLAKRLRLAIEANGVISKADTLAACEEIDRYYNGMLAWKQTAATNDRKLTEEIAGRVNDRIAARAAPAQPDSDQLGKAIGQVAKLHEALVKIWRPAHEATMLAFQVLHSDDIAVDRFAEAMKARLAMKRDQGRGGWDDPQECSIGFIQDLLENATLGKPLDIGNYAMMLWNREQMAKGGA